MLTTEIAGRLKHRKERIMKLNGEAYRMEKDRLVYDISHTRDAGSLPVAVPEDTAGVIKRGQVLDFKDGQYALHTSGGTASAIVAEDNAYAADDTIITAAAYISGTFRLSACISDVELTTADLESLRSRGIYLK